MIFFNGNTYAKVWKVTPFDKYIDLQISTSEKGADGTPVYSRWFPRAIGHAFNSLKGTVKEGDRILITKAKFTNESYIAKDNTTKSAMRFIILEAEVLEDKKEETATEPSGAAVKQTPVNEEDPW